MEPRFEDLIQEGINKYLLDKGIIRDNANTNQLGKALTEFYIKDIGQYLYKIYEDDVEEGLKCDGKGDLNIDFAYKYDNTYYIFQSKYKGKNTSVSSDEITGFYNIHRRLLDKKFFNNHANSVLRDIIGSIQEDSNFYYFFLTNDKVSERNCEEFEILKKSSETEFVTYELKQLTDLKKDHRIILSENESITDEVIINIESAYDTLSESYRPSYLDLTHVIGIEENYKSILCTIRGSSLKNLWDQHKSKLFNYNIRGFLGENPINKKLKQTIDSEPDKFYFYNNGISAICTDIKPIIINEQITQIKCSNFQIINGAQTTTTIGRYKNIENLKQVRVLLKITKAEDYKKEKGLNKKIVTYNNSQTIIKAADFRSNDEIQIFLEKKLSDFKYYGTIPYKQVEYLRKRFKVEKRKDKLYVNIDTLARVLYVFDNDPILIFKGTKYLFDIDENNGKYWHIFGNDGKEVYFHDEKRINKIMALYFIWIKIEDKLKSTASQLRVENKENTIEYQALLAKWHFLWAYGFILKHFYADDLEAIFKKIVSGKTFEKADNFIIKWFNRVSKTIAKCIEKNYKSTQGTEGSGQIQSFNFKNWLRSSVDFEVLKDEFKWMDKEIFPLEL